MLVTIFATVIVVGIAETGQTVVYRLMISVVMEPVWQFVIVDAQEVMV